MRLSGGQHIVTKKISYKINYKEYTSRWER